MLVGEEIRCFLCPKAQIRHVLQPLLSTHVIWLAPPRQPGIPGNKLFQESGLPGETEHATGSHTDAALNPSSARLAGRIQASVLLLVFTQFPYLSNGVMSSA